jgi:hypothetical protein
MMRWIAVVGAGLLVAAALMAVAWVILLYLAPVSSRS